MVSPRHSSAQLKRPHSDSFLHFSGTYTILSRDALRPEVAIRLVGCQTQNLHYQMMHSGCCSVSSSPCMFSPKICDGEPASQASSHSACAVSAARIFVVIVCTLRAVRIRLGLDP